MTTKDKTGSGAGAGPRGVGFRDEHLGAELRELGVPDRRLGFFEAVEARSRAEGAGDGADCSGGRGRGQSGRRWLRLALFPIPLAVLILLLVWVFSDRIGPGGLRPEPATAADVKGKVATAMTDLDALRGTLIVVSSDGGAASEMRWSFVSTTRGDFRLTGVTREEDLAYDAALGRELSLSLEGDDVFAGGRVGLAGGPPDPHPSSWVLERDYGSFVRALLDASDFPVEETGYAGRAAWKLDVDVEPNAISASADHLEIIVDQATGFPVRVMATLAGELSQEVRVEDLEFNPTLAEDAFTLEFLAATEVNPIDEGFRRISAEELSGLSGKVGYTPLVPAVVPEGFRLAEVSWAEQGGPTGVEGMNPPAAGVVSMTYRRGFDSFTVSTRLVGADPSLWSDPLGTGEGFVDNPEELTLAHGTVAGARGELVIDPRGTPHVWAFGKELVVVVAGDLTRGDLIQVIESLAPAG